MATNGLLHEEVADKEADKTPGRRIVDPELIAMSDVLKAVADLDLHSQYRVLTWAKGRVDDSLDTERSGAQPLAAE